MPISLDRCPAPGRRHPRSAGRLRRLRTGKRRPAAGERGAALVEFSLVMPVLLLFVMGIIDFASAFNDYNSVRQGVREGARQVVVGNWTDSNCTSGTSAQKAVCLTERRIGLPAATTYVKIKLEGTYIAGDPVTVCSQYRMQSITGMFATAFGNKALKSSITMRLEQINDTAPITNYAETLPSGLDWSWC